MFFLVIIFLLVKRSIHLPQVCYDELHYARQTEWHKNFGFLAGDVSIHGVPKVRTAYDRTSIWFSSWMVLILIMTSVKIVNIWNSEFFFFTLGCVVGRFISTIFVAMDVWADTHIITPTPAYIRYLDN